MQSEEEKYLEMKYDLELIKDIDRGLTKSRFVQLQRKKNTLKAELKSIDEEMRGLEDAILDEFENSGTRSATMASGANVCRRKFLSVDVLTDEKALNQAMIDGGLAEEAQRAYKINRTSLKSVIAGIESREEPMPASFEGVLEIDHYYKVVVTGAGKE